MKSLVASLAVLLAWPAAAGAEEPSLSVDEIVAKTNIAAYYQGDDGRARVDMAITDSQGRTRHRELTVMRKDIEDGGKQRYLVHFHAPADVARMTFIVHKHLDKDDDRWLYLPAMDLEKRIAAADKRTSFASSDFFYEDVSGRSVDLDHHALISTTDTYYVLENTPKDPGSVEFSKYVMHIHKTTFIPVVVKFYDKKGAIHRTFTVKKVEKIQGFPTVTEAWVEDARAGSKTVVKYSNVKYNLGIPESAFSKRGLRRPPVKYMK